MVDWTNMSECMADAGCSETTIRRAEHFYQNGSFEDLIRCLRSCRCNALEEIHEKQKKLDRLDRLIRETKAAEGDRAQSPGPVPGSRGLWTGPRRS